MGRDGPTTAPEKVTVVSITVMGKYRVDATINKENMLQRIHTWVPDPVLGDMNYEHEFTNASYVDLGGGVKFPTIWHSHHGWDDNYQAQSINSGHNGFGGNFSEYQAERLRRRGRRARLGPAGHLSGPRGDRQAGRWRVPARRRVAQQRGRRVQGFRGRRGSAAR